MKKYNTSDPFVAFLYDILRDHLTAGVIEGLVLDCEKAKGQEYILTNGYIAEYAEEIVQRLTSCKSFKNEISKE